MDGAACFSPDYATARRRFRAAAATLGATSEAHAITASDPHGRPLDLTIDVARIGWASSVAPSAAAAARKRFRAVV